MGICHSFRLKMAGPGSCLQRVSPLYISHGGGPSFFMPDNGGAFAEMGGNSPTAAFLRQLAEQISPGTLSPRAIVVISAHWEEPECTVIASPNPELLFDYYGFPADMYELSYPCVGSPGLADEVADLLEAGGFPCRKNTDRGLDHGVFVPLKLVYPSAEIPVIQLSLLKSLNPREHINVGRALAPLADSGVLLLGSGSATHNMRRIGRTRPGEIPADLKQFMDWVSETLTTTNLSPEQRLNELEHWERAPYARDAHPREEHLLPLMVVAGAAAGGAAVQLCDEWAVGFSQAAFQFA